MISLSGCFSSNLSGSIFVWISMSRTFGGRASTYFLMKSIRGWSMLLVGEIDLAERVQVGHLAEDRIMVGVEIVDEDLTEIPPVLLLLRLLDLERLLERLVVDDPLLEEGETDFVSDVDVRHETFSCGECVTRTTPSRKAFLASEPLRHWPIAGFFGRIVAVSDETIVSAVSTIMMIIEIQSWMKSMAFFILYVVSFS